MALVRKLWIFPWMYAESLLISIALGLTGFAIQIFTNTYCPQPTYPANIIVLGIFVSIIAMLFFFVNKNPLVQWLMSTHASIAAISYFGILSILMGLIQQNTSAPPADILHNINNSWPYLFSVVFIITVLGMVVLKRIVPFRLKNMGFIFNHLGLWLILVGGSFGAGDMQRLTMETRLGSTEWIAYDKAGKPIESGIAVELKSFQIDFFEPALYLFDTLTNKILKNEKPVSLTKKGQSFKMGDYQVKILDFLPEAMAMRDSFSAFMGPGSIPAAYIQVEKNGEKVLGWVNPQNKLMRGNMLILDNGLALILESPQPKRYVSKVKVYTKAGDIISDSIEVNNPLYVDGWYLYQVSYDQEMGRWSETSTIELNRDPWLPVVYVGIFLLILGSIHLLFRGSKIKAEKL